MTEISFLKLSDDLQSRIAPEPMSGCWLWMENVNEGGYAQLQRRFKGMIHRLVYEQMVGKIPKKLVLDHLCRVRRCVNPAHLEPVTMRENILRGEGLAAQNARKTECIRGHTFSAQNTAYVNGKKRCKVCCNQQNKAKRIRRKALFEDHKHTERKVCAVCLEEKLLIEFRSSKYGFDVLRCTTCQNSKKETP